MKSLKGFGLMQRDRAFGSYEDTEARYELRPSAWVTPVGDWGPGRVELLQFAIPDETHDNVAAYWVPEKMPAPGQSLDIAWQISWQGKNQQVPPNGWVTQSRRGFGFFKSGTDLKGQVQYVIDFAGPALDVLPEDAKVEAVSSTNANGRVLESLAYKNPVTGAWRVTLRVQQLNAAQPVELRSFLKHDNHTVSETWPWCWWRSGSGGITVKPGKVPARRVGQRRNANPRSRKWWPAMSAMCTCPGRKP